MNAKIMTVIAGLLAMTALAGCNSSPNENIETPEYPAGCSSNLGFSEETGDPCDSANVTDIVTTTTVTTTTTRSDMLMPVPNGVEGYSYGEPMNADEVTDWFTPIEGTSLHVNSAGKPYWVCGESIPDSGIASWCNHYYEFSFNAFQGWYWQGVASGEQRIQLRADVDDTVFYMTNVPFPPQPESQDYCMDCKG